MLTFNFDHLNEYSDGNKELEEHLIALFIKNLKNDTEELDQHFETRNFAQWAETAHKLFGATSHIGAERLAVICNKAQHAVNEEESTIKKLHGYIQKEYNALLQALNNT